MRISNSFLDQILFVVDILLLSSTSLACIYLYLYLLVKRGHVLKRKVYIQSDWKKGFNIFKSNFYGSFYIHFFLLLLLLLIMIIYHNFFLFQQDSQKCVLWLPCLMHRHPINLTILKKIDCTLLPRFLFPWFSCHMLSIVSIWFRVYDSFYSILDIACNARSFSTHSWDLAIENLFKCNSAHTCGDGTCCVKMISWCCIAMKCGKAKMAKHEPKRNQKKKNHLRWTVAKYMRLQMTMTPSKKMKLCINKWLYVVHDAVLHQHCEFYLRTASIRCCSFSFFLYFFALRTRIQIKPHSITSA